MPKVIDTELPLQAKATKWLGTVPVVASVYADAGESIGSVRMNIFRSQPRKSSRGEVIPGNGLNEHGAIIRRGRKVLIDVIAYGDWLAGRPPAQR